MRVHIHLRRAQVNRRVIVGRRSSKVDAFRLRHARSANQPVTAIFLLLYGVTPVTKSQSPGSGDAVLASGTYVHVDVLLRAP